MPPLATASTNAGLLVALSLSPTLGRLSMLSRRIAPLLCSWTCLWLLLISSLPRAQAAGSVNVSIANTSPQIIYTPFLCNATTLTADPGCLGAWNETTLGGIPIVSTTGPAIEGADIVPQMFMAFRASALYMSTSVASNASANFTVSSASITASRVINSGEGLVAIVNLAETELTTLTITFIPGQAASQLDIGSILITVTDPDSTSSFLPTMTLPPSITLPTFIPTSTAPSSSPSPSSTKSPQTLSHRAQIAEALGLVLGLGVGLSIIAGAILFWWKRRRRLRAERAQTNAWF